MMKLPLLLCLFYYSGASTISVTGKKGSRVTLPCEHEAKEIGHINLFSRAKIIHFCQKKNCNDRIFKKGSCDIIIKDLTFSDAGKYLLNVYYNNDQGEVEPKTWEYQLRIHDEISVKTGERVTLDVLRSNADEVVLQNKISKWTEVWKRRGGAQSDSFINRDENLIINNFTANDAGTYIVLDSEGEILITVTVTESKGNLNTDEDESEHLSYWILAAGLTVVLVLVLLVVTAVVLYRRLHTDYHQRVTCVGREEQRSGDSEALEVRDDDDDDDDVCRGSGEQDQTLQGSGHTDVS